MDPGDPRTSAGRHRHRDVGQDAGPTHAPEGARGHERRDRARVPGKACGERVPVPGVGGSTDRVDVPGHPDPAALRDPCVDLVLREPDAACARSGEEAVLTFGDPARVGIEVTVHAVIVRTPPTVPVRRAWSALWAGSAHDGRASSVLAAQLHQGVRMPYVEGRVVHDADAHIMEWPTWLVDYAEPAVRERLQPRSDDDGSGRALDLDRVREKHASAEYRAVEAAEIMSRKNFAATGSFIAEDRPEGARPARVRQPADLQHVPQRPLRRARAVGPRAGLRRGPGPQPGDGRVLLGRPPSAAHLLRAAGRLRPGEGHGRRGGGGRRGGAAGAVGLPEGPLAEPHRPRPGVGDRAGGRRADRVPRRRGRAADRPGLLPERPADPAGLPRRRGELPVGQLHGHPEAAGADAGHDDLRRRARAVPRPQDRRDRAGCDLDARAGSARWSRRSRPSCATRSASRPCRSGPPSTCSARSGPRRTRPRTWAGSPSRSAPTCACSRRTTRTWRAAGSRSSASRPSLGDAPDPIRQAFYCDNFVDLMGPALRTIAA